MAELDLSKIFDHHGGLENWHKIKKIECNIEFGGLAFLMKMNMTGKVSRKVIVHTRAPIVEFEDFPKNGFRGIFNSSEAVIENFKGEIMQNLKDPRTRVSKSLFWSDLHLLYFAGYALWNYLNSPFIISYEGAHVLSCRTWKEMGQIWQKVQIKFKDQIPTHSPIQEFYFDEDLEMKRVDYNPVVFARWAKAAHYCQSHKIIEGFSFPTYRYVVPRKENGSARKGPKLVWIKIKDIKLVRT